MKSRNKDLNLKMELPRYHKFDRLEMTYIQLYWAFWGRHWIKVYAVIGTTVCGLPNVMSPTNHHHQGYSGLFKTAGFAGCQLEVKAID